VSRTIQYEGIGSLRIAIERAKTIKLIQEGSFEQRKKNANVEKGKTKIIIILIIILIGNS